ncbi:alpha/beta fold hydrolase [Aquimonas sp.]|jgi:pimeloyl-ACP methyl ester carboxylesterase|uniref:alpha/beta fold hydrolase n=1 Tax=Aquimonas sp. TaxID=1872588 RepID=UPI0037BF1E53
MRWLKQIGYVLCGLVVVACIAPYLVPMPAREPVPKKSPFVNGRHADVCGLRWHVQRWSPGQAPARARVLLIHGFAGSTFSWRLTGPALAEAGYEVLAVDLPPYGYSDRTSPDRPIAHCVATIVADEAGALPVVAVGHSMGASVAAQVSLALGDSAAALVLVDGGLGGRYRKPGLLTHLLAIPPLGRWAEVAAHYHMLQPERFAATLAGAYGRAPTEAEVDGYRTPLLLAGTAPRILRRAPSEPAIDLAALPEQVLIVWGRQDRWIPAEMATRTQQQLPRAQLHWIDAAGHNPMETHPQEFMQALLGFIEPALN